MVAKSTTRRSRGDRHRLPRPRTIANTVDRTLIDTLWTLIERREAAIDDKWIKGIRKGWKKWTDQRQDYPGRAPSIDALPMEFESIRKEADSAVAYLKEGRTWVRSLQNDMLFNKGYWTLPGEKAFIQELQDIREKVVAELDTAEKYISAGISYCEYWKAQCDLSKEAVVRDYTITPAFYTTPDRFKFMANSFRAAVATAVETADAAISGRMLRYLTKIVKKAGGEFEMQGIEPEELKLGDVTVIFHDTPTAVSPAELKKYKYDERGIVRNPRERTNYIEQFLKAKALIAKRGLSRLWKGHIVVLPTATAPENKYGKHFGVGGNYDWTTDVIRVFMDPNRYLHRVVLHEIGHRYYFKEMSAAERAHFDQFFGDVAATSEYGSKHAWEDFAEVFMNYVLGAGLTRDQIDRFKSVLKGVKSEALDPDIE